MPVKKTDCRTAVLDAAVAAFRSGEISGEQFTTIRRACFPWNWRKVDPDTGMTVGEHVATFVLNAAFRAGMYGEDNLEGVDWEEVNWDKFMEFIRGLLEAIANFIRMVVDIFSR
jgi:hypothetical protein